MLADPDLPSSVWFTATMTEATKVGVVRPTNRVYLHAGPANSPASAASHPATAKGVTASSTSSGSNPHPVQHSIVVVRTSSTAKDGSRLRSRINNITTVSTGNNDGATTQASLAASYALSSYSSRCVSQPPISSAGAALSPPISVRTGSQREGGVNQAPPISSGSVSSHPSVCGTATPLRLMTLPTSQTQARGGWAGSLAPLSLTLPSCPPSSLQLLPADVSNLTPELTPRSGPCSPTSLFARPPNPFVLEGSILGSAAPFNDTESAGGLSNVIGGDLRAKPSESLQAAVNEILRYESEGVCGDRARLKTSGEHYSDNSVQCDNVDTQLDDQSSTAFSQSNVVVVVSSKHKEHQTNSYKTLETQHHEGELLHSNIAHSQQFSEHFSQLSQDQHQDANEETLDLTNKPITTFASSISRPSFLKIQTLSGGGFFRPAPFHYSPISPSPSICATGDSVVDPSHAFTFDHPDQQPHITLNQLSKPDSPESEFIARELKDLSRRSYENFLSADGGNGEAGYHYKQVS